ncbi:hypothetical protein PILCRDRAFT_581165 [Piloderma croceum F 1598]|uniref:THO1-MOS11 C-terminal domain-containing protein n=1 Tax=Piloderma croceum (strain F 1598) TaxID=765440 RepID=A0A0C3FGK7_PILCF|nr:hypothetical protein PILCRDRAFT_581165 [Piloderma croceum F 1598]
MSEAKLKSLKVIDLKDILAKASVSVPAKANKQDLIARVLASPAALDVYNKQQNPTSAAPVSAAATDDLLAPPEDFDWEGDETGPTDVPSSKQPAPAPARAAKPPSKAAAKPAPSARKPAPVPAVTPPTEPVADTSAIVDEELEKRKKRAARFGVPLVETPKSRPSPAKQGSNTPRTATTRTIVSDESDKLQARAARFGIIKPAESRIGKKRSVEEVVDAEELERRKKRAERFGIPSVA